MKRLIFYHVSGVLLLMLFSMGLNAQDTAIKSLPAITVTSSTKVPDEVTKAFGTSFEGAVNPTWYKLDKNYMVKFIQNDQKNHAMYAKSGHLMYHIQYGNEQSLPGDIKRMIQAKYVDYTINTAIYIKEDQRKIWLVNIEDQGKMIIVRVEDGNMEEVESYNKS